ncbi:hypothetical protein [Nonomuraea cavernae]|uniref:Uncharacterized protein n=1 Tax=Nonomuraea cavernae TaxID=2045107 RepID=A0A918DKC0_9ACTN|nr:hypothetical protein [Nonomuraea cavernae]MCA2186228.1 hypothetical protein [Nonomuraea cavernae]GGO69828.1 hypothetical protein GCM10012289_31850 [Nonomuraea cavernae]
MATLTAGVAWFAASPAAADDCAHRSATPNLPAATTTLCDGLPGVQGAGAEVYDLAGQEGEEVSEVVTRTAKRLGLTGLATARPDTAAADLAGGVASGRPALPSGVQNPAGLRDVSTMTSTPDLPGLPTVPSALPVRTSFGELTDGERPVVLPRPGVFRRPVDRLPRRVARKTLATVPEAVAATGLPRTDVAEAGAVGDLLKDLDLG